MMIREARVLRGNDVFTINRVINIGFTITCLETGEGRVVIYKDGPLATATFEMYCVINHGEPALSDQELKDYRNLSALLEAMV